MHWVTQLQENKIQRAKEVYSSAVQCSFHKVTSITEKLMSVYYINSGTSRTSIAQLRFYSRLSSFQTFSEYIYIYCTKQHLIFFLSCIQDKLYTELDIQFVQMTKQIHVFSFHCYKHFFYYFSFRHLKKCSLSQLQRLLYIYFLEQYLIELC